MYHLESPRAYADMADISLEIATIRFNHFKELAKRIDQARICPRCSAETLDLDSGDYEENIRPYVFCTNDQVVVQEDGETVTTDCEFSSSNIDEFEPLLTWFDFDVVLEMAVERNNSEPGAFEKQLGCSWEAFVQRDTLKLLEETKDVVFRFSDDSRKDGVAIIGLGSKNHLLAELVDQLPDYEPQPVFLEQASYELYKPNYFSIQKEEKKFLSKTKRTKKTKRKKR